MQCLETRPPVCGYGRLARRIFCQINRPAAQRHRRTVIERAPDESPDDWAQLLDALADEEHVRVVRLECGAVQLTWRSQHLSCL